MTKNNQLCITFDLEDTVLKQSISDKECYESSYEYKTQKMLHWLENKGIKATFFVVGSLARENTNLIKIIASKAHKLLFIHILINL